MTVSRSYGSQRWVLAVLIAAIVVGVAVRFYQIDDRTLTHPEFYVPAIELPEHVSQPHQRMTTKEVLDEALFNDVHPPGYYLVMLYWSKVFGTELLALRLPSLLFGAATLLLLFAYARRLSGVGVALLATWVLALHGLHVFWSQNARDWTLVALLAVASSLLLLRITDRWNRWEALGYVLTAAAGLWVEYYFWPIFATQVLWVALREAERPRFPPVLGAQLAAAVLATPILLFVWEHSAQPNHLPGGLWPHVIQTLQFGGVLHRAGLSSTFGGAAPWISAAVALGGAAALVAGLRHVVRSEPGSGGGDDSGDWRTMVVVGLLGAVLATVFSVTAFGSEMSGREVFLAALAAPWALLVGWWMCVVAWPTIRRAVMLLRRVPGAGFLVRDPALTFAIVPFVALAAVNVKSPVLVGYALVSLTPLVLVPMLRGVAGPGRARTLATTAVLVVCVFSVYQFATEPNSNRDYQGIAEQVKRHAEPGDVVLLESAWWTAPLHYYLKPSEYRVVPPPGSELPETLTQDQLPDRVWVVNFGPADLLEERIQAVAERIPEYRERERYTAVNAGAALFTRTVTPE